jgi:REP element-mobilizing transposase RayT
MQKLAPLVVSQFYHIYDRGINRENIFFEERNYRYFLDLYIKYITPVADTYAYCLLKNHFHLLVQVKETFEVSETSKVLDPNQQFSNFLNAYAKAINKAYNRTGSLFEGRFGRIPVTTDAYLMTLIHYIHFNPQKHRFVADFRDWPYSSYHTLRSDKTTKLRRAEVIEWFNGRDEFDRFHQQQVDEKRIGALVADDD